jgi:hypothetical protein
MCCSRQVGWVGGKPDISGSGKQNCNDQKPEPHSQFNCAGQQVSQKAIAKPESRCAGQESGQFPTHITKPI